MSQNFRALFIPKSLRVTIACIFFRGIHAIWFETATQTHLYGWNKFRSSLERNFGSFDVAWEKRMVKEFRNCIDIFSDGSSGSKECASPSNVLDREARDNDDDDNGRCCQEVRQQNMIMYLW